MDHQHAALSGDTSGSYPPPPPKSNKILSLLWCVAFLSSLFTIGCPFVLHLSRCFSPLLLLPFLLAILVTHGAQHSSHKCTAAASTYCGKSTLEFYGHPKDGYEVHNATVMMKEEEPDQTDTMKKQNDFNEGYITEEKESECEKKEKQQKGREGVKLEEEKRKHNMHDKGEETDVQASTTSVKQQLSTSSQNSFTFWRQLEAAALQQRQNGHQNQQAQPHSRTTKPLAKKTTNTEELDEPKETWKVGYNNTVPIPYCSKVIITWVSHEYVLYLKERKLSFGIGSVQGKRYCNCKHLNSWWGLCNT